MAAQDLGKFADEHREQAITGARGQQRDEADRATPAHAHDLWRRPPTCRTRSSPADRAAPSSATTAGLIARDALQHWLAPDEFFGHGELLRERARDAFTATFRRVFGV